ncbi:MAG: DUF2802 domain-containing protein [Granulosicoccus sp.]
MTMWVLVSSVFMAVVAVICVRLLVMQIADRGTQNNVQDQLNRIEDRFNEISSANKNIRKRLDQLSMDVMHKEIYQNASDRHQLAIKDAKAGRSLGDLMQRNGLSSDEASLIIALHGDAGRDSAKKVANANLTSLKSEALD